MNKRCPKCGETKPRGSFGRRRNGYSRAWCRLCEAAARREWYAARGPDTATSRRTALRRYFGMDEDDYARMASKQGHLCAICRRPQGARGRRLFVDHCHATGWIRGLLCARCNTALGMFGDDVDTLLAAIAYLQRLPGPDAKYVPATAERAGVAL